MLNVFVQCTALVILSADNYNVEARLSLYVEICHFTDEQYSCKKMSANQSVNTSLDDVDLASLRVCIQMAFNFLTYCATLVSVAPKRYHNLIGVTAFCLC
jgi:hypothetical protein